MSVLELVQGLGRIVAREELTDAAALAAEGIQSEDEATRRVDILDPEMEGVVGLQQNLWVKFRICSGNAGRRVPLPLDPRTAETTCFMG